MNIIAMLGTTMGIGLVSGINLYATILVIGLAIRFGLYHPTADMAHLQILSDPYVLGTAGALYVIEFFADKIPWLDSLWDGFHTFIRPLGATAIGVFGLSPADPATQTALGLLSGSVAFTGHSAKAGTRLAANHSPEPFTNIVLSIVEDILAVFGTWLSIAHPLVMLALVLIFLAVFAWLSPKIFRLIRIEFVAVRALLKKLFTSGQAYTVQTSTRANYRMGGSIASGPDLPTTAMPEKYVNRLREVGATETVFSIRCVAGKGVKKLKNSIGFLHLSKAGLDFITKRAFLIRHHRIDPRSMEDLKLKNGLLFDQLTFQISGQPQKFMFFKHQLNYGRRIVELLKTYGQRNSSAPGSPND